MSANAPGTNATPNTTHIPADRMHLLGAAVSFAIILMLVPAKPVLLAPLLILPVLFAVKIFTSGTTVSGEGITAAYGFGRTQSVSWEDFAGVRFGGASTFARRTDGSEFTLPGVTFNTLPRLSEASAGRIPDALTEGRKAADDKVVIIHRDGRQVLVDKDSPEAAAAAQASAPAEDTTDGDVAARPHPQGPRGEQS